MLLVPIPWAGRVWALPFLTVLVPSERSSAARGRRHKTLIDTARQMLIVVARWLPDRRIVAVTDSGFSAIELLNAVRTRLCLISRLRLDARLFAPAPPRKAGTMGRPRRTGERLPTLAQRLVDPRTVWKRLLVPTWYGSSKRMVEVVTGTAVWSHPGMPVVPLRWLLVRDPIGTFKPQAFLCTDCDAGADEILSWFVRRWTIEVTFAEVRRHLGVETQRQWSDKAIARTTPVLLGLFSIVALQVDVMVRSQTLIVRSAGWYRKERITFSDALAAVRRQLWTVTSFQTSPPLADTLKISRHLYDRMADLACYAA